MGFLKNAWVICPQPRPQASLRLFCFTYAGGGTTFFRSWGQLFPDSVEICPIRLPGRESRLRETPCTSISQIVSLLMDEMRPFLDKPFAFYGHSMGGIVAYEMARALQSRRLPQPKHLLVSGCRAPHVPDPDPPIYHLSDDEFIPAIGRLNGTPAAVLENKELLALMIPILRADFEAIERYEYQDGPSLSCSITAVSGDADPKAGRDDMLAWGQHTTGKFSHHERAGDHFFIHQDQFPQFLGRLVVS